MFTPIASRARAALRFTFDVLALYGEARAQRRLDALRMTKHAATHQPFVGRGNPPGKVVTIAL